MGGHPPTKKKNPKLTVPGFLPKIGLRLVNEGGPRAELSGRGLAS